MSSWASHHMMGIGVVLIVGVVALLTFAMRRAWPLLIPVPAVLAGLAWYGWEFSGEAAPLAAAILILGYLGVAIGAGLRWRRTAQRHSL